MIKSISYDQTEILSNIISLYVPSGQIELDPCYSKGVFYKDCIVPEPKIKMDISPQITDVKQFDCRNLPFDDSSISSIIFDPPFLATTGASLHKDDNNNIINKRFGVYESEAALHSMFYDSLKEFYRILVDDGVLVIKCQDKISSGKSYMSHVYIANMAEELGYYIEDLFILLAKSRIVADWQLKNQQHARKFHSYFWVMRKPKRQPKMSYGIIKNMVDNRTSI